tara:strand:+ start:759 stop:1796 length:1038 start_codon:yes stop_codon:yes gene_type:complete
MSKARELAELGAVYDSGALSNRNLIINGGMQVSQRGTSFTTVANNTYTLDRFNYRKSNDGNVTITQDSSGPDGFSNSLKIDVTTADTSIAASQLSILEYNVEAQDLQRLGFGTSSAKNFTLSFYVKSNKTGTYAVNISQSDNSSKQATLNYTIDSANTWERKSLTFTGDTSGVINDDNGIGFLMYWWLAVGTTYTSGGSTSAAFQTYSNANAAAGHAVNLLDDTSNEWYITGVQLEVGSEATPFEQRSIGDELARCQRYYFVNDPDAVVTYMASGGYTSHQNTAIHVVNFPVTMRAAPTVGSYTLSQVGSVTTAAGVGFCRFTGTASSAGSIAKITSAVSFDSEL